MKNTKTISREDLRSAIKANIAALEMGLSREAFDAAMLAYELLLGDFYSEVANEMNREIELKNYNN